jgi:LuxR family maltose regulon positive regulatory protein
VTGAFPSGDLALPELDDLAPDTAAGVIVDSLLEVHEPLLLVIDDAHRITHSGNLRILTDLVMHAGDNLRILLLARSLVPLPVSTLRLKGLLAEFGPAELALDASEAQSLAHLIDSSIDPARIEMIRAQTEGWIGGIRMALTGRGEPGDDSVGSVPGLDTLADDVLMEVAADRRPLVAALSLLDEIEIPLVEAIAAPDLDGSAVRDLLSTLANLGYLQTTPGGERWRTLHPAIRQALRQRIDDDPRLVDRSSIHARASHWYERSGKPLAAVRHALEAGRPGDACDIIERAAPRLLNREDWRAVDLLLQLIPLEVRNQRPRLLLAAAWVSHLSGRFEPILDLEQLALHTLAFGALDPLDQQEIPAEFTLLKHANSLLVESSPEAALNDILAARRAIPSTHRFIRGLGFLLEGWALACSGRFDESIQNMTAEITRQSDAIDACSIRPMIGLLFSYRVRGSIGACERTAEDIIALSSTHDLPISKVWGVWLGGMMAYEQDNLPEAEARLALAEQHGDVAHLLSLREAMFCLAMTRMALGKTEEAHATVRRLREFVLERHSAGIMPGIRSFEARLALQQGDLDAVRAWLASSQATPPNTHLLAFEKEALTRARALIATEGAGGVDEARRLLQLVRARAERANSRLAMIEVLAISAMVHLAAGDQDTAVDTLGASLALAGIDRYRRTYLDLGNAIAPLLARLDPVRYPQAADLLDRLEHPNAPATAPAPVPLRPASGRDSILSVLTIREAEVLERLMRRLTNAEIAEELSISLQTVKSHAASIYGKLAVNSRREAIIAAEAYDMGSLEAPARTQPPRRSINSAGDD